MKTAQRLYTRNHPLYRMTSSFILNGVWWRTDIAKKSEQKEGRAKALPHLYPRKLKSEITS